MFDSHILIITSLRMYYFQNNHKHKPLIMLHMTTRILNTTLKLVTKHNTKYIK
jgi:hypothetical protein